jgi:cobaltochelatase CobT
MAEPSPSAASAPSLQALVRYQQQLDALCAATLRALSGQPGLHYRGRKLWQGQALLPSFAPHLHPKAAADAALAGITVAQPAVAHDAPLPDDLASFRGAADGVALRLRASDRALHQQLRPALPMARRVFDLLEQYRAESLVQETWPGVRANMRHRFEAWSQAFVRARLHESAQGILLLTVAHICRSRVTGDAVPEALEDLLEATRFGLASRIGHALYALRRSRHSQADYAVHALEIGALVAALVDTEPSRSKPAERLREEGGEEDAWLHIWVDFEADSEPGFASALTARDAPDGTPERYCAFTTAYDRTVDVAQLVRAEQLASLRTTLDAQLAQAGVSPGLLARQLQARLALPEADGWDSGQEAGRIDGSRLGQLIASPKERRLFRIEHIAPHTDCALSVLVDCSGSMKAHALALATALDVLLRALERAGVSTELLGYTTGAWNGGRALRDWRRAGKPPAPGRLNELCHIVFKDHASPYRSARRSLAALLKPELFRECVDGEALRWASARLLAQDVRRRILLVVSDGSPMDGATVLANDPHYLDRDLQATAAQLEAQGQIELRGIGVGLDLSGFYQRSTVLDLGGQTTRQVLAQVVGVLGYQ